MLKNVIAWGLSIYEVFFPKNFRNSNFCIMNHIKNDRKYVKTIF